MSEMIVEVRGVTKDYDGTRALRDISLSVKRGEWLSITGPSGSGKSTLLNIIGGLDKPTEGSVYADGVAITSLRRSEIAKFRREHIGFVFQQFHLIPYLTALENVMLAQYFHSMADEEEARNALERVGLGQRLKHLPSQLSVGEQQRVCIARALINEPKLFLADEPTGNLDQTNGKVILDIFRNLHRERQITIILITHDPVVAEMAQRTIRLVDGKLTDF